MLGKLLTLLGDRLPGIRKLARLPLQLIGRSPFNGDLEPTRVPLLKPRSGRPTLPFPHPWNYQQPISILATYWWDADEEQEPGRHNRYLDIPLLDPVLVTRDPEIIRAITSNTGDKEGQFDRDTMPSTGIARATGKDTLLFANGRLWRTQRMLSASPFGKTTLFEPERFHEFAESFSTTVRQRLDTLRRYLSSSGHSHLQISLEPEIQAVMLEMLTNNFFGADVPYEELRGRYVPALERVITRIVSDTVLNKLGLPVWSMPRLTRGVAQARDDITAFEELTDLVLSARATGKGLWGQFKSDAPDEAIRSNIRVFLAGALEATTSYATWAISHLARNSAAQEKVFQEVKDINDYTPDHLAGATYFGYALDETLRLSPSLYFLPRRATVDTSVEKADGRRVLIPRGTHILLDVWHANRHEDHWGVDITGYPAADFVPERWAEIGARGSRSKDFLHFGFGHGPRVCPGKFLGQLEVGLVVGTFVKLFKFQAVTQENPPRAGVSTKPLDGTFVELALR